jgi:hypothetical protein
MNLTQYTWRSRVYPATVSSSCTFTTSSVTSTVPVLHPYFITGFADAESCFYVRVTKKNNMKLG